ncbi:glycoside hydrolase family 16 protein [Mycolicibacterium boenickei]|nr:glycoside hydrolase family 16 protein [Mycolicibacterium boenickei]
MSARALHAALAATLCVATVVVCVPVPAQAIAGNCPATAAAALGWGPPSKSDDFEDPSTLAGWNLYEGPGHAGNGRRTPAAVSVADGVLTITGDAQGDSEGMSWTPGQTYGRWEVCVRSPAASPNYHSVLLLWPAGSDGEIDFMEIADPTRQSVDGFVHYGYDRQEAGHIRIDATQWHSWAVEWSPRRIAFFVDGGEWWETTDPAHIPAGLMRMCMQLDNFGGDVSQGGQQVVDWARQYPLDNI